MDSSHQKTLKPILHEHNLNEEKQPRKKSISWDEEGIQAQEKERGKFPKITEPKTPFANDLIDEKIEEGTKDVEEVLDETTKENTLKNKHLSTGVDAEELHKLLERAGDDEKENERERTRDQRDEDEEAEKHRAFMEKRKKHYNEGNKMKKILRKTSLNDLEEEEENEESRDIHDEKAQETVDS